MRKIILFSALILLAFTLSAQDYLAAARSGSQWGYIDSKIGRASCRERV